MRRTTSPHVRIKESRIHSTGIFAEKDIPKGTRIIEYVGEKISKSESDRRADIPLEENKKNSEYGAVYIFDLNKRHDIDGNVPYNTAKFINHSCDPNCETEIIRGHVWIIALRDIKEGEELAYNYNYSFEDYEEHECRCGSNRCVGYILDEDHWPRLRQEEKLKKRII
ncbi:MAG: SET domain-containing protein-lysine N-methyltransferase [Candidatus Omnitrophica bacterium]|nr:SET domain-containing protein-lysine N-methyltransferase [Candidatus Omnitrophota bacterium]